jgi:hypothetical protein
MPPAADALLQPRTPCPAWAKVAASAAVPVAAETGGAASWPVRARWRRGRLTRSVRVACSGSSSELGASIAFASVAGFVRLMRIGTTMPRSAHMRESRQPSIDQGCARANVQANAPITMQSRTCIRCNMRQLSPNAGSRTGVTARDCPRIVAESVPLPRSLRLLGVTGGADLAPHAGGRQRTSVESPRE